ncbi:MAG: alpha,alpha-trehalase TreF [Saprospiraceae bacterium]|nr:alpha,alpha-trehalase TreF [Saprospiraceae bacterium]
MQIFELGHLFEAVQMNNILSDGKTFPDCLPKYPLETIKASYEQERNTEGFDLGAFIEAHFELPTNNGDDFTSDTTKSITAHITSLWHVLTRQPDKTQSSLIPLPYSFIVPGGRFREIYYWDSYFTMLGLQVSGRVDMIENMVKNFSHLLNTVGHIPNGNRTYYIGRSQPPFYALMIRLLSEEKGQSTLVEYLPGLEKEYSFWMKGSDILRGGHRSENHSVLMPNETVMNRYWDENNTPRPESYKEDVETAHESSQDPSVIYRHLRAAAESGWDFSSRWFKDGQSLATIHTTDIIPVDLNCLMWHLEMTLAEAHQLADNADKAQDYIDKALVRKKAINDYCWNAEKGFYFDYDFVTNSQTPHFTLAAVFPLFFNLANQEQAQKVAQIIENQFLQIGGVTTTLNVTGQQWDAPNGWAPLQWIVFKGLHNYGFSNLANRIKAHWLRANKVIYEKTGKMTEKYNVYEQDLEAGGGEYPLQDGFGWTNGVYLALDSYS